MCKIDEVIVETTARLHLGFLDLNFNLGRRFGSIGLSIDSPVTKVKLSYQPYEQTHNASYSRASLLLDLLIETTDQTRPIFLAIEGTIPAHAGFGSGTQLSLAVAAAYYTLNDLPFDAASASMLLDRGARSGIGIGAFQQGGFIVDGGKGASDTPAPIVSRIAFPDDWPILLIMDHNMTGVQGEEERAAFKDMPPASEASVGELCRMTLLKMLPALVERDFQNFSDSIRTLQQSMAEAFSPYQNGQSFRSKRVNRVLNWLDEHGVTGNGQSSWGPTAFAFIDPNVISNTPGESLIDQVKHRFRSERGLTFDLVKGFNKGASIIRMSNGVTQKG